MRIGVATTGEEIALAELTDIFIGAYGSAPHGWVADWFTPGKAYVACVRVRSNQSPDAYLSARCFFVFQRQCEQKKHAEAVGEVAPGSNYSVEVA